MSVFTFLKIYLMSSNFLCLFNFSDVIVRLDVVEGEEGQVDPHMTVWVTEVEVVLSSGMAVVVAAAAAAGTGDRVVCNKVVVRWTNKKPRLQSQLQSVA